MTSKKTPGTASAGRQRTSTPPATARKARQGASAPTVALSVLQHLRELYRVSQAHFQRIEVRCGLSGAQLWAMAELNARPGSTVSELSKVLSVHLSTASNLLDRLEEKGLVRRHRGPPDQRVVRVTLTPDGESMLRLAPKPAEGIIQDALQRMPDDALVRLERDLDALLQHAKLRSRPATMMPLADP